MKKVFSIFLPIIKFKCCFKNCRIWDYSKPSNAVFHILPRPPKTESAVDINRFYYYRPARDNSFPRRDSKTAYKDQSNTAITARKIPTNVIKYSIPPPFFFPSRFLAPCIKELIKVSFNVGQCATLYVPLLSLNSVSNIIIIIVAY